MAQWFRFIPLVSLFLAMLACSLGTAPTPTTVPQPGAASPAGSALNPRALDTAGLEECSVLADSDFSAMLGQVPADKVPEAEVNKTACYYNFSGGQTVYVTFITNQPGQQVYDSRLQYVDAASGAESLAFGETALLQEQDGQISIWAVVNGWYLEIQARGFEQKAVINLAKLFEARLIPYPQ
jgi:hypothetical protein